VDSSTPTPILEAHRRKSLSYIDTIEQSETVKFP